MRKAKPAEMVIGGIAALAHACAAVLARTGLFGIAPDEQAIAGLSPANPSPAGAHHP